MIRSFFKRTKNFSYYFLGLLISIILGFINISPFVSQVNNLFVDRLQGVNQARPEIVVVGIDDESLQYVGAWPWSWDIMANMIGKIADSSPEVVSVDVLLLESRAGNEAMAKVLQTYRETPFVFASKLVESTVIKPPLTGDNLYTGFVNFTPDSDGKIRRTYVGSIVSNGECEPSFAAKTFALYSRSDPDFCSANFKIRNVNTPRSSDGSLLFTYSDGNFTRISAKNVLEGNFPKKFFKDKIVLIGSTAIDLRSNLNDNFFSVTGQSLPGVDIHANTLNSFLNDQFHSEVPFPVMMLIVTAFNIATLYIYRKTRSNKEDLFIFLFLLVTTSLIGIFLFEFKINWAIVYTASAVTANYIYMLSFKFFTERMQKQFIALAFGKYINTRLLDQLERSPELLNLGGERREMTVYFSDIRGFTSISEKLPANELLELLNSYLGRASEIILNNEGTIDKFIGDGIMAFWNAPLKDKDHRTKALKSAMEISSELIRFNNELPSTVPQFNIGMGINTGEMIVGNIGGIHRIDYTVLGDNVNIGARLEALTKHYNVQIMVSAATLEGVDLESLDLLSRKLDRIIVKGRSHPMEIYQIMEATRKNQEIKNTYETAFAAYQKKKFETAKKYFRKLITKYNDGPSKLVYKRFHQVMKIADWDGVWHWEEK